MHLGTRVDHLSLLSEGEKAAIYDAALEILADVGMAVHHPAAVRLLLEAGCRLTDDERVLVPAHLVDGARTTAPSVVRVFDRLGRPAMELGGRRSYFGTGSDLLNTYDLETGEHRPSSLDDVARAARLVDALDNLDFVMSSAYPNEVAGELSCLLSFVTMVRNTVKPVVTVAYSGTDLEAIRAVAAVLRGGDERLRELPSFIVYDEPTSPLQHPVDSVDKLLLCADAGVPVCYVPAQMAGATAPITVAGQMALGTAESLFGLVLHQLRRPGAPFIYGHGHPVLDMQTAQSTYNSVEGYLCELGMAEMAKWFDLPNFGNAGTSDSQLVDAQAGIDIAMETLLVMQAGSNLNHNAGYLDFGLTGSLEGIVITDEVIAMCRRLVAGITVDAEHLAVDVVAEVGPGGHYLGQKHTRRHRGDQWRPTILNRLRRDVWEAEGAPDLRTRAGEKARAILRDHEPPPLAADDDASIDRLLAEYLSRSEGEAAQAGLPPAHAMRPARPVDNA
ncbi:MAG: trimethylamine methyltransferase [Actinobacteria bacterium]|nr:trimethylamine methyltransferase [Actinomycetota bacterium]